MRLASVPFLCTCIACVYLSGCKEENTNPAAVRPARVVVVVPHQLGVVATGAGLVQSRYQSPVGFEVGGRLVARYVDVGALVTKGQKLAKLSDVDYKNRVTAAEADLAAANAAVAEAAPQEWRYRTLLKQGGPPVHFMRTRSGPFRTPSPGAVSGSQSSHHAKSTGLHRTPCAGRRYSDGD